MYWVYIVESIENHRYYVGCTNNIARRISEHNGGLSKYTKNRGPWNLIHKEEFSTLKLARKREKQIKSWKKRAAIEKLINAAFV